MITGVRLRSDDKNEPLFFCKLIEQHQYAKGERILNEHRRKVL